MREGDKSLCAMSVEGIEPLYMLDRLFKRSYLLYEAFYIGTFRNPSNAFDPFGMARSCDRGVSATNGAGCSRTMAECRFGMPSVIFPALSRAPWGHRP